MFDWHLPPSSVSNVAPVGVGQIIPIIPIPGKCKKIRLSDGVSDCSLTMLLPTIIIGPDAGNLSAKTKSC